MNRTKSKRLNKQAATLTSRPGFKIAFAAADRRKGGALSVLRQARKCTRGYGDTYWVGVGLAKGKKDERIGNQTLQQARRR